MNVMSNRILFLLLLILACPLAHAIPNPEIAQDETLRRAEASSTFILKLLVSRVDLTHGVDGGEAMNVSVIADLVEIMKGYDALVVGDELFLHYSANYAAAGRQLSAYLRESERGVIGGVPPEAPIRQLSEGDQITAYMNRDPDGTDLVPSYFQLHEAAPVQTIELGESIRVGARQWVDVRLPNTFARAQMRVEGFGRGPCPRSSRDEVRALCRTVRTQFQLRGRIHAQMHTAGPPTAINQGHAIEVVSSGPDRAEIKLIDEEAWQKLWPPASPDRFSYGCAGGITGGSHRTEIRRDGRVTVTRKNTALGPRSISIVAENPTLAEEVFTLLATVDFDAAGKNPTRGSYSCDYDVVVGETDRSLRLGEHNSEDLNAVLSEAWDLLSASLGRGPS
jgi:hypothetical protein